MVKKKIQKLVVNFLVICVISIFVPKVMVQAEREGDYTYKELDDGTVEISGYWGSETEVDIPAMLGGKRVTSIGKYVFNDYSELTSVSFPEGLKEINQEAFGNCSGLTSITIPASVINISSLAFTNCSGLESIVVDETNEVYDSRDNCNAIIYTKGDTLCYGCKSTKIPNTVRHIGVWAFAGCSELTSISIPNSVTSVSAFAFEDCVGLTQITISSNITEIGDNPFYGCLGLESIVVDESNEVYDSRDNCNAIICTETNTLISSCSSTMIPKSVMSIGSYAFSGSVLETITIPDNVQTIETGAFYDSNNLTSISLPSHITTLESIAFADCDNLTNIILPANLTHIEYSLFNRCSSLSQIEIPDGVTSVGDAAFYLCSSLTQIDIPDGVSCIGEKTFAKCSNLLAIRIPGSVESIGENAFEECPEELVIYGETGSYAQSWAKENGITFKEDKWEYTTLEDGTIKITACPLTAIDLEGFIRIPETIDEKQVSVLGASLFENQPYIVEVEISEGIREIEKRCFYNCSALTTVELPESLCTIGAEAFYLCENLKSMNIPAGVNSIGAKAFWYTSWLKNERSKQCGTKLVKKKLDENNYLTTTVTICKPVIINDIFLEASGWIDYVGGTREEELRVVEDYTIDKTVSKVCSYAFYTPFKGVGGEASANDNIVRIIFENPDTIIDPAAFYGCERLEDVILPANLKTIHELTFADCPNLKRVEIPEGVTSIADNAFLNCTSLEEVRLPSTIESIGNDAFAGVVDESKETSFTVTIPDDLDVSNLGLENMTNIQYITFNVAEGSHAYIYFQQCENVVINTYIIQQPEDSEDKEDDDKEQTDGKEEEGIDADNLKEDKTEATTENVVAEQPVIDSIYTVKKMKYKVTSKTAVTFVGTTNKKMKKVSIPSKVKILGQTFKVTAIGKKALKKYTNLKTLVIGSNVKTINDEAFMKCTKLKKVTIGKNVKTIGEKAFYGDKKLKQMVFKGTKVSKIGKKAMKGVSGVKVKVPTNKAKNKYAKLLKKAK